MRIRIRRSRRTQLSGPAVAALLGGVPLLLGWGSPGVLAFGALTGGAALLYHTFGDFSASTARRVEILLDVLSRAADAHHSESAAESSLIAEQHRGRVDHRPDLP